MIIALFGPPGAGKGTQGRLLADQLHIPHLSTGDMLREIAASGTKLGKKIATTLAKGHFVTDEMATEMVAARIDMPDCAHGFILDGFPRTVAQVASLDEILGARGRKLCAALLLDVPDNVLLERIAQRAATRTTARADDDATVAVERLAIYREKTAPLLALLSRQNRLARVSGEGSIDDVFHRAIDRMGLTISVM